MRGQREKEGTGLGEKKTTQAVGLNATIKPLSWPLCWCSQEIYRSLPTERRRWRSEAVPVCGC